MVRGKNAPDVLQRTLGLPGAILLGLGSMVGTGIFVSIGLAAGVAGAAILPALLLAAILAACNGLSSARLASVFPVSGGTYEYGYRLLNPTLGFTAGWTFIVAKSASAATAALGAASYLLNGLGIDETPWLSRGVAIGFVLLITLVVLAGLRRSGQLNGFLLTITIGALLLFVGVGLSHVEVDLLAGGREGGSLPSFLEAVALLFVAFTGYGRVATLGEEVHEPERTIPRGVIGVVALSLLLYLLVTIVAAGTFGPEELGRLTSQEGSPLQGIARLLDQPLVANFLSFGAITAMLGVLLNLILGLSRVFLAMGRRRDMPRSFGTLNATGTTPVNGVIATSTLIILLILPGNMMTTWSISAFAVLLYYSITNLSALRLGRLDEKWRSWGKQTISVIGLVGCLGLAGWVEPDAWMAGGVLVGGGVVWKVVRSR